jgi:hypothetical protein
MKVSQLNPDPEGASDVYSAANFDASCQQNGSKVSSRDRASDWGFCSRFIGLGFQMGKNSKLGYPFLLLLATHAQFQAKTEPNLIKTFLTRALPLVNPTLTG